MALTQTKLDALKTSPCTIFTASGRFQGTLLDSGDTPGDDAIVVRPLNAPDITIPKTAISGISA